MRGPQTKRSKRVLLRNLEKPHTQVVLRLPASAGRVASSASCSSVKVSCDVAVQDLEFTALGFRVYGFGALGFRV